MAVCPYYKRVCQAFLSAIRDGSPGLADRTEEFYCGGAYEDCARFELVASQGSDKMPAMLGPWDRSHAGLTASKYTSQPALSHG